MEILIIIGLVILVGAVLLWRRSGRGPDDTDLNTGNPPSANNDTI
ncbi:hypothetical protein ABZ319_08815 [Nocardia sp. NPDC005978]